MLRTIRRAIRLAGNVGYVASALIIVMIAASVSWEIVSRYIVGVSSPWVTEISGYLLAGTLFLAMGYTYRINGHVRMSVLLDAMRPETARLFYWLTDVVVAVFAAVLLWQVGQLTYDSYVFNWKSSTNLEIRLFLPQALMTLGALIFLLEIMHTAMLRRANDPIAAEEPRS